MTLGDDPRSSQTTAECVFRLPDLGEGLVSGEILGWLVEVGDEVEVDQPVVMIETEKTNLDLPIPYRGRVARLHGRVHDVVAVGAPLVTVEVPAGSEQPSTTHLVGQRSAADANRDQLSGVRRLPPKPRRGRVTASPVVRRLARELDVDLRAVTGTGKSGAITKEDVRAASAGPNGSAEG